MKQPKLMIEKMLRKHSQIIYITPMANKTKTANYDPDYKNESDSFSKTFRNKIGFRCYVRDASAEGLIRREIGLQANLVKELWISSKYISWIKTAEKIEINGEFYSCWSDAVGNRFSIYSKRGIDLVEILLFKLKR